jgi:predicted SprT family Zn-dependent metalloprotease
MNLKALEAEAKRLFKQWECEDWTFTLKPWETRLGLCDYKRKAIGINKTYAEQQSSEMVLDTLKHEIAHIKAGRPSGHGIVWRKWAEKIGCTPRACSKVIGKS